ncbi:hypothetical protein LX32DRAFT_196562 [Colletotrichum zoysiae]|uniref:Uncharacterized protein n=1 Tax=Colletotrichum zoysiae TaxID=1216348 RepID=A0AAD9HQZ8_9PEZI|nr:hypothetical protein LX32DRAFT_196562 [Colletotrichum zoysiae]
MNEVRCIKTPSPYGSEIYRIGRRLSPNPCIAADVMRRRDTNSAVLPSMTEAHPHGFGQLFSLFRTEEKAKVPVFPRNHQPIALLGMSFWAIRTRPPCSVLYRN